MSTKEDKPKEGWGRTVHIRRGKKSHYFVGDKPIHKGVPGWLDRSHDLKLENPEEFMVGGVGLPKCEICMRLLKKRENQRR